MTAVLLAALFAAGRVLTLEEAVNASRQHQPQLREARANTDAAVARADEARAPLLPQLNATATYLRTTSNLIPQPGVNTTNGGTTTTTGAGGAVVDTDTGSNLHLHNNWRDSIALTQLIYDFGLSIDRWKAAKAQADAQRATELSTILQSDFTVRSTFFLTRADKALVKVAQDTLDQQIKHRQQTEGFVRAGTQPEIALAQAKTNEANARVSLIQAQNNYETAKVTLNQAMGSEDNTDYDVDDTPFPLIDVEDGQMDPLLAEAIKARPEVASIQELIRVNELTISSVRGNYLPSIAGQANFTQGGPSLDNLGYNFNFGVGLTWNLFGGGLTVAQVHEAQANLGNVLAQLDLEKLQIRVDVNAAMLAVRAAKSSLSATAEALENAKLQLKLAEQRYQVGVGSSIELTDAQVALTAASGQSVQADDNLSTARAQLLRALGRQ
ncbi:MAG TPA: TolC family protein [Myxococcales bacterium]|nr:TolC family protein [Myxococcales bacterium]